MIDTFIAFTFLLVTVNLLLTVALIRLVAKLMETANDATLFMSGIRTVQVSLIEKSTETENENELRLN
jgi:hypothetical protein